MNDLEKQIEALLFVSGDGMTVNRLAGTLKKTDAEINASVARLKEHLESGHHLTILEDQNKYSLATSKNISKIVEDFAKEEFSGDLSTASLEVLAIISYKGPLKKSEIDYIRGVNSSFMVRNLLMRGLVERIRDAKDSRAYVYRISSDFLKFLGISSISELPEFGSYFGKLEDFLKQDIVSDKNEA